MKVNGKVIVVTGAGSGMGRALSLQLIKDGARVAGIDINEKGLEETRELAGNGAVAMSTHVVDITDRNRVEALPAELIALHGAVDGIINNAGIIQPFVPIKDLDYDRIERVFNINLYGTLYMVKSFLPALLERPEAHILNISSMGGFIPFPGQSFYGASKAAVKLLTEGLYAELKDSNVKVTVVHPGAVNTNITKNSNVEMRSELSAEEQASMTLSAEKAAEIILNGMKADKYRVMVGKDARFLDLFYRFSPKRAVDFITKKMAQMAKAS